MSLTKEADITISKLKSMLVIFFDSQSVIHKEYVPSGQTVNDKFYTGVLECLLCMNIT